MFCCANFKVEGTQLNWSLYVSFNFALVSDSNCRFSEVLNSTNILPKYFSFISINGLRLLVKYCFYYSRRPVISVLNYRARHTCPIHPKWVESTLCVDAGVDAGVDESSWQKSCGEIHEVILTGSWHTLQEVWLQIPEMVILSQWGLEICRRVVTTRHELTRLVTSKSQLDLWLETRLQTKEIKQGAVQCISCSESLCRLVIRLTKRVCGKQNCASKQEARPCNVYFFLKRLQTSDTFTRNTGVNKSNHKHVIRLTKCICWKQNCASNQEASNVYFVLEHLQTSDTFYKKHPCEQIKPETHATKSGMCRLANKTRTHARNVYFVV